MSITQSFTKPAACTAQTNTAPTVQISGPVASGGSVSVTQGTSVTFTGTANDTQDGNLTGSLDWSSNLQGSLFVNGGGFSTNGLSLGTHTITASVSDSGGLAGSSSIQVTVTAPSANIVLTAVGVKVKGNRAANLSWTGAAGSVDVFRNNAKVATVPGPTYQDNIGGKGGGTFSYKVCNAGTATCSNSVNVVF